MPRIPFPTPETMDAEQRRVHDRIVSGPRGKIVGPLRAALHSPELADLWQALGAFLRYRTTLTPRQSELAILVTGRACNSPFEWYAHDVEARKAGVEPAVIEALLAQRRPDGTGTGTGTGIGIGIGISEDDALVIAVATELNQCNSVSDATYARALQRFGPRTLVELTTLVGYYTMVAMTLNAHEIPLPEGVTPAFPRPQDMA